MGRNQKIKAKKNEMKPISHRWDYIMGQDIITKKKKKEKMLTLLNLVKLS